MTTGPTSHREVLFLCLCGLAVNAHNAERPGSIPSLHCVSIIKPSLRNTTCCQTGCTTRFDNRLNEQWLFVQHGCQSGCQIGLYNRFDNPIERTVCSFNTVVNRLYNRFDNRLYRVNRVLVRICFMINFSDTQEGLTMSCTTRLLSYDLMAYLNAYIYFRKYSLQSESERSGIKSDAIFFHTQLLLTWQTSTLFANSR